MEEVKIVLARIDNRLVHGQVGVTWTNYLGANLILVADDEVSEDEVQQDIMSMTAMSSGADIRFFSIAKTIEVIHNASEDQKIFIITKTPKEMRMLVEGGVPIQRLNVGNMHFDEGKRQVSLKVFVDDQDLMDLKRIEELGVDVFIQDIPGKNIEKLK